MESSIPQSAGVAILEAERDRLQNAEAHLVDSVAQLKQANQELPDQEYQTAIGVRGRVFICLRRSDINTHLVSIVKWFAS